MRWQSESFASTIMWVSPQCFVRLSYTAVKAVHVNLGLKNVTGWKRNETECEL